MEERNTMFYNYPDVVSVYQLKEMLQISKTLAYKLVNTNCIKGIKVGRDYKIPKVNIINYLTS